MRRAIVVGTGAGGSTAAKELQGTFEVTILEAGREFKPFSNNLGFLSSIRKSGLFFDEREIQLLFPAMKIRKTGNGMVLVNGIGLGGTTTIATANGVRMDGELKAMGINLDEEFQEIFREIPITTSHQKRWHPVTKELFDICCEMGLDPHPTPKMGNYDRCIRCGRCVLGCTRAAKWDARHFLTEAFENGAALVQNCTVEKVVVRDGIAVGVETKTGWRKQFYPADVIVLAAGGFGTPVILEKSGISCESHLFVDPVICVAAQYKGVAYNKEISMPFIVQREGYILSPYIDYLSYFFNREWRYPIDEIVSLMIKLADTPHGNISNGSFSLELTDADKIKIAEGIVLCREILRRFGVYEKGIFLGTVNAGHPGGMLPLTGKEAASLHNDRLPENVYVADATLLPNSLGNPPILTIIALAKRISKICMNVFNNKN
jgi:choline dehydrogenase-like flavoprotein